MREQSDDVLVESRNKQSPDGWRCGVVVVDAGLGLEQVEDRELYVLQLGHLSDWIALYTHKARSYPAEVGVLVDSPDNLGNQTHPIVFDRGLQDLDGVLIQTQGRDQVDDDLEAGWVVHRKFRHDFL